ncbi:uncharacterized protein LOC115224488 [Octopus sinensis]|uniref:Uncharacterized protein LOC115224488 n=1 Tax=Octopus sinensis TaxID=2607531 RepID=A0A6P7TQN1_9MOLL|nr:uncharacterized protein LOC115224488 [Octopus sinensis]
MVRGQIFKQRRVLNILLLDATDMGLQHDDIFSTQIEVRLRSFVFVKFLKFRRVCELKCSEGNIELELELSAQIELPARWDFRLSQFIRDLDAGRFAAQLLDLGNGNVQQVCNGDIPFPNGCGILVKTVQELITNVYPNIGHNFQDHDWICERAILAPKKEIVQVVSWKLMQPINSEERHYLTIDTVVDPYEAVNDPTEFPNSLDPPEMPSHRLTSKKEVPIMVLENLDPPKMCNGTKLIVRQMHPHLLEATNLTGQGKAEDVFIPRIPLIPAEISFEFKRLQFPARVCFAMLINNSQGPLVKIVELHLMQQCFSPKFSKFL